MVSANTSELNDLSESFNVNLILLGCQYASAVTQIFLYDDSIVATVLLECFFRFDGLVCVEASGLDGDDGGESFANLTISLGLVSMSNREFVLGPIRISIKFVC